ncbi:MAG: TetR/AcrR family transcriptional regulator [Candidatus Ozemobacteraceae bacterium]
MPRIAGRDRKQELLDAARDLIFTEGATGFTIRRLAERVEVSEAAVYRHFPNKEALLLALLDMLFNGWDEGIQGILATDEPASKRLEELAKFHLDYLLNKQFNPLLLLSDATDPAQKALKAKLQHIASALYMAIDGLIQEGKESRLFAATLDHEAATVTFLGVIQSTVLQWSLTQSKSFLRKRMNQAVAFLLHCFQK